MGINLGSKRGGSEAVQCTVCDMSEFDRLLALSPALMRAWEGLPRRNLQPGQALIGLGEPARHLWRIERGLVRLYFLSPEGRESNRSFHAEGKWVGVGVPAAASETASPYLIEALEASQAVELSYAALRTLQDAHPQVGAAVQNALANVFQRQSQREAELLLLDAEARYRAFLDHHGALARRIPLHHVASYLGITNVALSRIRRRMKSAPG